MLGFVLDQNSDEAVANGRLLAIAGHETTVNLIGSALGWPTWLGLHLVYLIGFRNHLVVLSRTRPRGPG